MQPMLEAAARRLPATLLTIARRLGEPMQATRLKVLPVSSRRRFQIWEFQALGDSTVHKVIALDIRQCRIADWKLFSDDFDAIVQHYQQRIEAHHGKRRLTHTTAAAA